MKRLYFLLTAAFCLVVMNGIASGATYYSQGSLPPNLVTSWNTVRAGGGLPPANFTSGDTFVIQDTHNMSNPAAWAVSGVGNKIQIESGGTLTAGALVSCTVFQIDNGGKYVVAYANGTNGAAADIPGSSAANRVFGASSTVEIQRWGDGTGTGPVALPSGISWGNLTINITTAMGGSWQQGGNITTINGNFSLLALGSPTVRAFRFNANSPATITVNIGGDIIVSGGILDLISGTSVGTFNVGGSFNQTGGTFTSSGAGVGSVNFTGGSSFVTFTQSSGTFTIGTLNWTIASGKTVQFNNNFTLAASRTFTIASGGMLLAAANISSGTTGTITVNGEFRITDGGAASGTNAFVYGATGTLGFVTAGSFNADGASGVAVYWPTSSGPFNITVLGGGLTMNAARAVNGTVSLQGGDLDLNSNTLTLSTAGAGIEVVSSLRTITGTGTVSVTGSKTVTSSNSGTLAFDTNVSVALSAAMNFGASLSTIKGTLQMESGGSVSTNPPTYNSGSLLKYNTGGTITRGTEWGNVTSGPGYPRNVQISNTTTFNITTPMTGDASVSKEMGGDLTVDLGSTFDLTGMNSFTFCHGSATNNGTFTGAVSQIGQFRLSGNWTNNGTYNNGGGTAQIWFDGAGVAQTLGGTTVTAYGSLQINNSLGVTVNTALTATQVRLTFGPFNNGSNVTLTNGALIFRSSGTFSSVPTFGTTVNVTYGNSSGAVVTDKELPTDATVLNNLTNSNTSFSVTLGANVTVNGTLTLTADLNTGSFILTENGGSSGAGDVVGTVRRTDVNGTSKAFGNPNVQIANGGTATQVDVMLVKGVAPSGFPDAVLRTYTLTESGGDVSEAIVQLRYVDPGELNGNSEGSLSLYRAVGSPAATWIDQGFTTRDVTNNWVSLTSVSAFSSWTLADGGLAPTAVKLTKFNAASYADGVQLNWESGYEVNNLGYHLYREQNGRRTRVTPAVVAGSALTVGPGSRLTAGYSYSWFDQKGTADTSYYLEAIDLDGTRQWAGPLYPNARAGKSASPRQARALLLSELASGAGAGAGAGASSSTNLSLSDIRVANPSLAKNANLASITRQQEIAAGRAVKIQVRQSGWHRITQPELVAAGFDATTDARLLQLYVDGQEVPIALSHGGPRLNAGDTLEFFGVGLDLPTTDTRVYWLVNGNSAGKRINGKADKWKAHPGVKESPVRSFDYTTERREKVLYFANLRNGDAENIFGAPVLSEPVNQTLTVRNLDTDPATAGNPAQLEVALQGLTAGTHQVQLEVNGTPVGTITFGDRERQVQKFAINRSLLREGDNAVSLVATAGDSDISLIDWIRLTYAHQYVADNNLLQFSVAPGQTVRVGGFTTPNVRVLDITNPQAPVEVGSVGSSAGESGSYTVTVTPGNSARTLLAVAEDLAVRPAGVTANQPSSWNAATNGADMVIITHQNFRQAVEPLATLRRNQGLTVAVVDVEDVYDEYSYGAHGPLALKRFLASAAGAAGNWSRKPQFLLLVGDSSWDPRNYLDQGANDFVPTKLIDTNYMETGSDDWLADFNDVGLVTMAIGRLPGRTAAEVSLMVSKILTYEQEREVNAPLRDAVMVSDSGFESQSAQTQALLPSGVGVQTINRSEVGNDDLMRGQIVDALNAGPMLVNYYGHGSVNVWTGASLLDGDSAAGLTNTNRLSLYVMMTCLNGYAHDAYIDSLGESALKAQNGGAVAVWASSGFTDSSPQFAMNSEFYRLLFGSQTMRLGEATRSAKAAISDPDVRRTWTLLGDPAMRIR